MALKYLGYGRKLTYSMHLDEDNGTDIGQDGIGSEKDLGLGSLDVYLHYIGRRVAGSNEVVQGYGGNFLYRPSC